MQVSVNNLLSCLKNSISTKQNKAIVPFSKANLDTVKFLRKSRYISGFEVVQNKTITIFLSYDNNGLPALVELTSTSKPGRTVKIKKLKTASLEVSLSTPFFNFFNSKQNYGDLIFILR